MSFTFVVVVVLFHIFGTTSLSLSRPLALAETSCCCVVVYAVLAVGIYLYILTRYRVLRHSVSCAILVFEPRVHSHHPRRGSLTARYSGLCPFILQIYL